MVWIYQLKFLVLRKTCGEIVKSEWRQEFSSVIMFLEIWFNNTIKCVYEQNNYDLRNGITSDYRETFAI